jgi:hypothetical protein
VTLLVSLLEGEVDHEIINRMTMSLDFNVLKDRMVTVFKRFAEKLLDKNINVKDIPVAKLDKSLRKDSFDDSVREAFEIFNLMHSLADNSKTAEEQLQRSKFTADQHKAFDFIRSHTGRIEVNINSILQRIYFPIRPVCYFISKGARE